MPMADPSREFEDLYDRMGQLLNMAFGGMPFGQMQVMNAPWVPLADVSETDDAHTVEVELPGVRRDQINVELSDRELVISGEIPEPEEESGQRGRRSRRTGRFEFRTMLPGEVSPDGVSATLSDGVLSVKIPKAEEAKPRRIEVTG
ncbi:MAG: Hsp20/alpha crystallin family protein [Streptosporangiaceae bacterium]